MGKQVGGVELLLEPETEIPGWIWTKGTRRVELEIRKIHGRDIPVLRIQGGEASFADAHSFIVRFQGSRSFSVVFQTPQVLEIRDFNGGVLKQNHYLCEQCFANTGEVVSDRPSKIAGRVERTFRCAQCGHQWERTI